MHRNTIGTLALGLLLLVPVLEASAATATMSTTVVRTLATENERFGGCMARVAAGINEATGLDCERDWVTFSCSGEHTDKASAMRMFDSAQLAFMADRRVVIEVDDARKHNNFCFARRVDVMQ